MAIARFVMVACSGEHLSVRRSLSFFEALKWIFSRKSAAYEFVDGDFTNGERLESDAAGGCYKWPERKREEKSGESEGLDMVRLADIPEYERNHLMSKLLPPMGALPWVVNTKPPLKTHCDRDNGGS